MALGNGAPDVSAVVNGESKYTLKVMNNSSKIYQHINILRVLEAIKINASEGIPLSLGELTGGGMFVQTVVVGRIIFLGSSAALKSNDTGEKILGVKCREDLIRDITMYAISASYVFWVCAGGVIFYHHVVVMLLLYCSYVGVVFAFEIRRYYSNAVPDIGVFNEEGTSDVPQNNDHLSLLDTTTPSYDEEDQSVELSKNHQDMSENISSQKAPKRPDPPGIKQSLRVLRVMRKQRQRQQQRLLEKRKSFEQNPQDLSPHAQCQHKNGGDRSWSVQLFSESIFELSQHFHNALYLEIWTNSHLSRFEWWCMLLEIPFIVTRKLVTPIPCEEEYHRSLVAYSIALSPLWILFYLTTKVEDFDPFCALNEVDRSCFPSAIWPCFISFIIGGIVLKYAPREDTKAIPLRFSLPIALYGFLVAATWIDVISDQLVNLLEFIGVSE